LLLGEVDLIEVTGGMDDAYHFNPRGNGPEEKAVFAKGVAAAVLA
jgi:hypothetical protein